MGIPKELLVPDKLADNVGIVHWKSLSSLRYGHPLLHLSQLTRRAGLDSQEKTEMDLADLEFATSLAATKVGESPATLGTDSLFKLVKDVVIDMGKCQELVATMESPELAAARELQLQLGFKIGKDIMGHLHPVFCLFGLFCLHALESRMLYLPRHTSATGPAAWSFHQGPSVQGTSTCTDNE
jgi:hypothetical protein